MSLKSPIIRCCLLLLSVWTNSFAWWTSGHEIIADIAYHQLSLATKQQVDALLAIPIAWPHAVATKYLPTPSQLSQDLNTFILASGWADAVKHYTWTDLQGDKEKNAYSSLHFINTPLTVGTHASCLIQPWLTKVNSTMQKSHHDDVVSGIESAIKTLTSDEAQLQKIIALRYLIHLVGDLHMPFHATDPIFVYQGHKFSTFGGNEILFATDAPKISQLPIYPHKAISLTEQKWHEFWDAAVADYQDIPNPEDSPYTPHIWEYVWSNPIYRNHYLTYIDEQANRIQTRCQNNPAFANQIYVPADIGVEIWASQTAEQACELLAADNYNLHFEATHPAPNKYKELITLTDGVANYETQTQPIAEQQLYLAGMRLANLLNAIYSPNAADVNYLRYVQTIKENPNISPLDTLINSQIFRT